MPIPLTIVVSGQAVELSATLRETYGDIIRRALVRSGNTGRGVVDMDLELRDVSGRLLEPGVKLRDLRPAHGATLFLSPRAGAGA